MSQTPLNEFLSSPEDRHPDFDRRWAETAARRALSNALIDMRRERGKTQKELAQDMGKDKAFVCRMESATAAWPKAAQIALYAEVCGYLTGYAFFKEGSSKGEVVLREAAPITASPSAVETIQAIPPRLPLYDVRRRRRTV